MVLANREFPRSERKVQYLLLHLGVPFNQHPPYRGHVKAVNASARSMGIIVERVVLAQESRGSATPRYCFRFPRYVRDDFRAVRIGESILYAANIMCGPIGDPHESASVLPVPIDLYPDLPKVSTSDLIDMERNRSPDLRSIDLPGMSIGSISQHVARCVTAAWRAAPVLLQRDDVFRSARYLCESQEDFFVYPGQYSQVLHDRGAMPRSGWEESNVERALLASFKSIEALIGSPPSDDRKLKRKIQEIGLDPNELFDYPDQQPLYEFIRRMEKARDIGSAHGGTPHAAIRIRDMFLFQDCAKYMLMEVLENIIGEEIF